MLSVLPSKQILSREYSIVCQSKVLIWKSKFGMKDLRGYGRKEQESEQEYIRNQIQEDIVAEQITMAEYIGSFTGEETKDQRKKKK